METLTKKVAKRGYIFWLDIKEVGPYVTAIKQYEGIRYLPGESCEFEVGSVILLSGTATHNKKAIYEVCILLPDGSFHTVADCSPPNCGQILRERTRTWLTLSQESRIIRAVSEIVEERNKEIDAYLDAGGELDDDYVYNRLASIDTLATTVQDATGKKFVDDNSIFDEFQRWLEAMAQRTKKQPEELYAMLIRGAQRAKTPHVNYLKKFNRAIRFQDKPNE